MQATPAPTPPGPAPAGPGPAKSVAASSPPVATTGGDFRARQEREVEANYEAFRGQFNELLRAHPGKYALMRGGECVEFFSKMEDALKAGKLCYKDGLFSVQKVHNRPVDLGLRRPPVLRGRPMESPVAASGAE